MEIERPIIGREIDEEDESFYETVGLENPISQSIGSVYSADPEIDEREQDLLDDQGQFGSESQMTEDFLPVDLNKADTGLRTQRFKRSVLQPENHPVGSLTVPLGSGKRSVEQREKLSILTPQNRSVLKSMISQEESELPILEIEEIVLNLYDPDMDMTEMKQINRPLEKGESLRNLSNTVNDPDLGPMDYDELCSTCNKEYGTCPGHYGYIPLNFMIYNPLYMTLLVRVMNCICTTCSRLLLSEDEIKQAGIHLYEGEERLKLLEELSIKNKECRAETDVSLMSPKSRTELESGAHEKGPIKSCGKNPLYKAKKSEQSGQLKYVQEKGKGVKTEEISNVYEILKKLKPEDLKLLGFSENSSALQFITKYIIVLPPCTRNYSYFDGIIGNDTIVEIYNEIIKLNLEYNELPPDSKNKKRRDEIEISTYKKYASIIDDSKEYEKGKGSIRSVIIKSLRSRLEKKKGLVRGSIMGKRVNFSARSVASPDPSLKMWQVRLPEVWRSILTRPVTATTSNISSLEEIIQKGEATHYTPGSGDTKGQRFIIPSSQRNKIKLQPGDKVDRWAQSGDWVMINRQPTIHKYGFLGFEVVFSPLLTVGIPLSVTRPLNADFDGDELNIHMVQTEEAQSEIENLLNVTQCIMNDQINAPIIGYHFDSLTNAYLLTQPDTVIEPDAFFGYLTLITPTNLIRYFERLQKYGIPRFTGKALFSALLPKDFYYEKGEVLILEGILVRGVIDAKIVGPKEGSIIQELWKRYGRMTTATFISDGPILLDAWMKSRGFSIGLKDCFLQGSEHKKIIQTEIARTKLMIESYGPAVSDSLEEERRERDRIGHLNRVADLGTRITRENLPPSNALRIMEASGAKGSVSNTAQITSLLGQQFLFGKRMKPELLGRTLPYFQSNDLSPEARGYVYNSFMNGLDIDEFFFHQAASREGLTDTASKTPDVGYIHREMVKSMENISVWEDGTVRLVSGEIVQFVYGDDGFQASELQSCKFGEVTLPFFINLEQVAKQINLFFGY